MKILAIAPEGKKFIYKTDTAHKVSKHAAPIIQKVLNTNKYKLPPGFVWYMYDVDIYDPAHIYASVQKFTLRKGIIKEKLSY